MEAKVSWKVGIKVLCFHTKSISSLPFHEEMVSLYMKKLPDDMGSLQGLVKLEANGIGIQEVPTSITPLAKLQVLSLAGCKAGESKSRNLVLSLRSSPTEGLPLPSLSGLCSLKMLMNK